MLCDEDATSCASEVVASDAACEDVVCEGVVGVVVEVPMLGEGGTTTAGAAEVETAKAVSANEL